jgi:hypothetical protein
MRCSAFAVEDENTKRMLLGSNFLLHWTNGKKKQFLITK